MRLELKERERNSITIIIYSSMADNNDNNHGGDIHLDRKLTDAERESLVARLRPLLPLAHDNSEGNVDDDVLDLLNYAAAMVSNQKSMAYVERELVEMEMDHVCPAATAFKLAQAAGAFVQQLLGNGEGTDAAAANGNGTQVPKKATVWWPNWVAGGGGNALTQSGALGASREGRRPHDNKPNKPAPNQPASSSREKRAFDKLTRHGGRGAGRERGDGRGGRGGGGRDSNRGGRGGGRGGRDGRGGRLDGPPGGEDETISVVEEEVVVVVVTHPMIALRVAAEAAVDATVRCHEVVVVVVLLPEGWTIVVRVVVAAAATGVPATTTRKKSTGTRLLAAVVGVLLLVVVVVVVVTTIPTTSAAAWNTRRNRVVDVVDVDVVSTRMIQDTVVLVLVVDSKTTTTTTTTPTTGITTTSSSTHRVVEAFAEEGARFAVVDAAAGAV